MDSDKLRALLRDYVFEYPTSYTKKLMERSDYKEIVASLVECTNVLTSPNIKIKTRIYWVINGLKSAPRCMNKKCARIMDDKNIRNMRDGYPLHCCSQCAKDSSHRKALYEMACELKYGAGITNASQAEDVKLKKAVSTMKHYGVENPMQSDDVKSSVAETNMTEYGTVCPLENSRIRKKAIESCVKNWGVTSFSKTYEYKEKTVASNRRNFGVDYPNQDPAIRREAQKRYIYGEMQFDSAPELAFFIYSIDHNIDIVYQPDISFEYAACGKLFKYQPDFAVGGRYVEIKGDHFFEGKDPSTRRMINPYDRSQDDIYGAKYECMVKNGVLVITSSEYIQYVKYMEMTYGKDWKDKYRRKSK